MLRLRCDLQAVGQRALATMQAVLVNSHAHTSTASLVRAVTTRTGDFVVLIDLVELQDSELGVFVDVVLLLWLGVGLLLALLTTTKSQHQVQSGLLLDVVIRKSTSIFELLSSEDQTLLIRRNSFLVLDLLLNILNGI